MTRPGRDASAASTPSRIAEFPSAVILVDMVFLPLVLHVAAGTAYGALTAHRAGSESDGGQAGFKSVT